MTRFATHKIFLLDGHVVNEDDYQSAVLEVSQTATD
jgi:hypothetical protein